MKWITASAIALLGALPALAAEPLSGEEFEAYVTGKTLYFGSQGVDYGVEEYLDQRRVRWSFLDGNCKDGFWYEADDGQICFIYEDTPAPQCWTFFKDPNGLRAIFENDPEQTTLYEAKQNDDPMLCYGPDVGV